MASFIITPFRHWLGSFTLGPATSSAQSVMSFTPESPNVVVVGGGIVGASIAWHLAAQEANVTIVADKFGGVATPNSFAWINAATDDKTYYDFRMHSINRWLEISELLPQLPIHWSGAIGFDKPAAELEEYYKEHKEWGYDVIRVNRSEMSEIETKLEANGLPEWAILSRQEGAMEADQVAIKLIEDAKSKYGATVVEVTIDSFLKEADGKISGVLGSMGRITADHVVLAGGLGSVPLLADEGVELPVSGREGLLINTKPVKDIKLNKLYSGIELHMRQTSEGRIRSGKDYSGGDTGEAPELAAAALFAKVQEAFKAEHGNELEYDYYTIGVRPDPQDGLPILGPSGLDGLTVAVMHSGVTNAAAVGELLAKQVLKGINDPLLDPYRLSRFSASS